MPVETSLTDTDFERAATALGVDVASVRAVTEIEAGGHGFISGTDPPLPTILFEAHVFSRLTGGRWDATHPNISSPTWNRSLYGAGGTHQTDRLNVAAHLDRNAALQSCSWGMFQIMGENYKSSGFDSIQAFVNAMYAGAGSQLDAFVAFVSTNKPMLQALQDQDWAQFARRYNGPGYAANAYDAKLEAAYDKWSQSTA